MIQCCVEDITGLICYYPQHNTVSFLIMHIINREFKCAIPLTFKCHEDILLLDKCVLCYRKCVKPYGVKKTLLHNGHVDYEC